MSSITQWAEKYQIKPKGVIHVGAAIGEERDEWAAMTKRVTWFEPNPACLPMLKANVEPLGHEVVQAAVGERAGTLSLNVSPNFHCSSILPLGRHSFHYPGIVYAHKVDVPVVALDEHFAGRYDQFDYLYLDTQGYEGQILLGSQKLLPHIKWAYLEYNDEELYTGCWLMPQLTKWMRERGLALREVERLHPAWGNAFWIREG
ncbi:MAG: hypothetical protein A2W31_05020 [Planctomycetes bacterium RBG_16_64_10]|nr:MAG: hypothetical protein A2W31_05020 [Planctomycetes bacterium RBG_16_64_10]